LEVFAIFWRSFVGEFAGGMLRVDQEETFSM
jgi:hypothetical protein